MSNHNRNYSQAYNNRRSLLDLINRNDPIKIKIIKPRDDWNSNNFSDYTNNINPFNSVNSNLHLGMGKPLSMYSNTKIFQGEQKESCMEKINLKIIKNYHNSFMKEKNNKFNNDYINTLVSLLKRKDRGYKKIRMLLSNKEVQDEDLFKNFYLTPNDEAHIKNENGPIDENVSEYSRTNKASKSDIKEEPDFENSNKKKEIYNLENKNEEFSKLENDINKKTIEINNLKNLQFQSSNTKSNQIQSELIASINVEFNEGNNNINKIENRSAKIISFKDQNNLNVNKDLVKIDNKETISNKDEFGKLTNFVGFENSNSEKLESRLNKILRINTKSVDFGNNQELKLKSILKSIKAEEEQNSKIHKYFKFFEDPKIKKEYDFKIEKRFYIKKETEDNKLKMLKEKEERLDKLFSKQMDYSKILKENLDSLKSKFAKRTTFNLESTKHIDYVNPKNYYNVHSAEKAHGNEYTEKNLASNSNNFNLTNNFNRTSKNTWYGFNKTKTEKFKRNNNMLTNQTETNKNGEEKIQFSKDSEIKYNKQFSTPCGPASDYTNSKFDNYINTTKNSNIMGISNFSPLIQKENIGNNAKSSKNWDLIAQYGKRDKNIFIPVVQRKELYSSPKRDLFSVI